MIYLAYSIPVILIILAEIKTHSKLLSWILLVYIWIIYSFNTYNGDFEAYYLLYNAVSRAEYRWHFEPAFSLIMQFCSFLGMGYLGFKVVLGLITVFLLNGIFMKYSKCPALALASFLVFPFLYNVSVVRGGISGLFICYAFCNYSQGGQFAKRNFLLFVLMATLFHYSAILFVLFLFTEEINEHKKVIVFSAVLSLIIILIVYSGLAVKVLSLFSSREKSLQWISTALYPHLNLTGIIMVVVIFVGNYCISLMAYDAIINNADEKDQRYIKLSRCCSNANCALFTFLPFAIMSDVMLRYIFEFMAVNICVISSAAAIREQNRENAWVVSLERILLLIWVFFLMMYSTLPYLGTDISAFKTLYNNLLFGQKVFI